MRVSIVKEQSHQSHPRGFIFQMKRGGRCWDPRLRKKRKFSPSLLHTIHNIFHCHPPVLTLTISIPTKERVRRIMVMITRAAQARLHADPESIPYPTRPPLPRRPKPVKEPKFLKYPYYGHTPPPERKPRKRKAGGHGWSHKKKGRKSK